MSTETDLDAVIHHLHGMECEGRILVVEREVHQRRTTKETQNRSRSGQRRPTQSPFGSKGWSRPKGTLPAVQSFGSVLVLTNDTQRERPADKPENNSLTNEYEKLGQTRSVLGDDNDASNQITVSATTSLPSQEELSVQKDDRPSMQFTSNCGDGPNDSGGKITESSDEPLTWSDFRERLQKPLSELLDVYGEADPNWAQQQNTAIHQSDDAVLLSVPPIAATVTAEVRESRLAVHGKASIHVELVSFGYLHGVPKEIRNGWCHAQPLPLLDCRDLPPVPPYLVRMDGLSAVVKRVLTKPPSTESNYSRSSTTKTESAIKSETSAKSPMSITQVARQLASQIFESVRGAMVAGHGPASPLHITVYCGSDSGRHRSVVVGELAATALRKLLRSHPPPMIPYTVSVSTRHRELDRKKQEMANHRRKNNSDDN
jgi:RNase adaptor protein for sRNA GlmZ degradation